MAVYLTKDFMVLFFLLSYDKSFSFCSIIFFNKIY